MRFAGGLVPNIKDLEEQILQFNLTFKKNEKTPFFLHLKLVGKISELVCKINVLVPQLFIITDLHLTTILLILTCAKRHRHKLNFSAKLT